MHIFSKEHVSFMVMELGTNSTAGMAFGDNITIQALLPYAYGDGAVRHVIIRNA